MSARIRGARFTLPALLILTGALIVGCTLLVGCGADDEPAEEPPLNITADEVPVVRLDEEGNEVEVTPEDQPDEGEPVETEEAPIDTEAAPEEAPAEEPDPPADAEAEINETRPEEESGGFFGAVGGGLKAVGVFLAKLLYLLVLPAAVAGTLFGMPGGVLVLADGVVFSAFHGWATPPWWVLLILLMIAVLAELAENVLSFAGVKRTGASNTTGVWVMVGGFAGAIVGGLLAPVLSSVGALAGPVGWVILSIVPPIGLGMLGGFIGGYQYELKQGKSPEEAKKAGWGALLGRMAGSFTKAMLVAVMAAVLLISTWGALF
ncbi:MAG: DUF456 family protein [Armatimonadia bacterium]|nr:DUF456 family protein [Armatimonadia bacterium]